MLQRARKTNSFLKTAFYILTSSVLFLLLLNIIFPKASWFKKPIVIDPVVRNAKIDTSKIEKLLSDSSIPFSSVSFARSYFDIGLKDDGKVYISSKKDIIIQISSLQAILKQLTINGKRFQLIDFRFDKPVIVFEE